MRQVFLQGLNPILLLFLISLGIGIQTSLFQAYPLNYLQPDVVLLAVIWSGLRRSFLEGGILTLIMANMAEIHSSAPQGLFLMSYMIIFLFTQLFDRYFVISEFSGLIGLTLLNSVSWKLTGLMILFLLGPGEDQWRHTLALLLPGAVMEAVLGIWAYRWFEKLDWVTYKNPKAARAPDERFHLSEEEL